MSAPKSLTRGLPVHEQAVIDAALVILGRRAREPGAVIDSPGLAQEYARLHLGTSERERFGVLFLDGQHALIDFEVLFEGTLTQTSVYVREVVRRALQLNAGAVILAHNHPSGLAEPSRADERLTQALKTALDLVDVRVLDHVVVGWPGVRSFAELDLLDPPAPPSRPSRSRRRGLADPSASGATDQAPLVERSPRAVREARPPWSMPGGFWCGWRTHCGPKPARRHCMASDLAQLRERAA